ncbi:ABC transporter ATP-binding protein [Gallaecimonas kandeliae]|uniref:ABC transporter ATP-binding protein n=1 Tax=Gallaecimonas kandeliae TaxID=3029055 RepID=UPI002648F95B|nr:ABC transporter ATP-binding protein [Gallaecimonas kandeliae]WKE64776.1 ABC transporter ATP-binding protein [Gallaecimonas kandeliae]
MLSFSGLTKSYQSGDAEVQALKGVEGHIARGDTVALCGPSGSGKSTLLNLCGLLDANYSGDIFLDGQQVPRDPAALTRLRREKIGFIFQHYNLIPVMTAFENIEYPLLMLGLNKQQRYQRVARMIDAVGLAQHAKKRPGQLSGGQQQRIAIARALVKEPALVIADEPTANLDTATATLVIDLMRQLGQRSRSTFVIATHDHRMTERCDRVLELSDGHLKELAAHPLAHSA